MFYNLPDIPYGKGWFDGSGGGEKKTPQLEEPHLHEPVSKSGKPGGKKIDNTVGWG